MKITKASINLFNIAVHFECSDNIEKFLSPYLDDVGVPTIGIGSTRYEDGRKVTMKDPKITKERAIQLFYNTLKTYEEAVDDLFPDTITQNEFDALVDFAYNVGITALKGSTLRKLFLAGERKIEVLEKWFIAWNKGQYKDGKDNDGDGLVDEAGELAPLAGLTRRRKCEVLLLCKGKIQFKFD